MLAEMRKWCDLRNPDQTLTLEKILTACFLNPDRKKFPKAMPVSTDAFRSLCEDRFTCDYILGLFKNCKSVEKLDKKNVPFYSTE